ncbi:TetR family transcriptional regulator C-terminal domain-containing protein [Sedimentitalea sp. XS_ASV28]|uniref:TetR family transcriptional regulator C-terminal domain-containing protein n=1 Tax=Sedimentitalea sp. XS_ASV28 TaxID=3241296 RepID=UPI003511658F
MTKRSARPHPRDGSKPRTRIQKRNRELILGAALEVFSKHGYRGATLDQISTEAGLSKPNLLYYYPSKEAIHRELLHGLLDTWLDPLKELDHGGEPLDEILEYVQRKLQLARDYPRESRIFANEILQGAPTILPDLEGDLKALVDRTSETIRRWIATGKLAPVDPVHLIFSIWALTQHYADFDIQVRAVNGGVDPFPGAEQHLKTLFRRMLTPD